MKLFAFCVNCGGKHEYTLAKPKFCHFCGTSFGSSTITAKSENTPVFRDTIETESRQSDRDTLEKLEKLRAKIRRDRGIRDEIEESDGQEKEQEEENVDIENLSIGKLNFEVQGAGPKKTNLRQIVLPPQQAPPPPIRVARPEGQLSIKNKRKFAEKLQELAGSPQRRIVGDSPILE